MTKLKIKVIVSRKSQDQHLEIFQKQLVFPTPAYMHSSLLIIKTSAYKSDALVCN